MFSNYLLLEANECCGTCDIPLKKCILHCLDGPKFHQFDTLCRAQASFNALPNNERGTKYHGLTYSARQNCP